MPSTAGPVPGDTRTGAPATSATGHRRRARRARRAVPAASARKSAESAPHPAASAGPAGPVPSAAASWRGRARTVRTARSARAAIAAAPSGRASATLAAVTGMAIPPRGAGAGAVRSGAAATSATVPTSAPSHRKRTMPPRCRTTSSSSHAPAAISTLTRSA